MRYELDGEHAAHVEISERWSRAEVRRAWGEEDPVAYWQLVSTKIQVCQLPRVDGDPVTDPAQLADPEILDSVDYVVFRWLSSAIARALVELGSLGEAAGRRLFDTPETEADELPTP